MKNQTLALVVLLLTVNFVVSLSVAGNFVSANAKPTNKRICYNNQTKEFVLPPGNQESITNSYNGFMRDTIGAMFFAQSGSNFDYVSFYNTTTKVDVLGGKTGYFTPINSIQNIVSDGKTLYVCGSFSKYGNDSIDQFNVVKLQISSQFDEKNSKAWYNLIFVAAPKNDWLSPSNHRALSCSTMFLLGGSLIVRESGTQGHWVRLDDTKWTNITANSYAIQSGFERNGTWYVLARDMQREQQSSDKKFIQKYTAAGGWKTIVEASTDTDDLYSFAVGASDSEVYGLMSTNPTNETTKTQWVYKFSQSSWSKIGDGRFSSSPSSSNALFHNSLKIFFDPFLSRLVVSGSTIKYLVVGTQSTEDKYLYARRITKYQQYNSSSNSYEAAYGGGLDTSYDKVEFLGDRYTCFYGSGISYAFDSFVPHIGRIDSSTSTYKLNSIFGKLWLGVDSDSVTDSVGVINSYALFRSDQGISGYIAGNFKTVNNITCNSVALISPNGSATNLGSDAFGVRNLPGNDPKENLLTPQGTIKSIEFKNGVVYVAGTFNMAGDVGVSNIAKYVVATKKWLHIGGGVSGAIDKMIYSDRFNSLFVIGSFTTAGNVIVNNIARYRLDSEKWDSFGYGFDVKPNDIVEYNGGILVAMPAGNNAGWSSQYFAFWNGYSWERFNTYRPTSFAEGNTCSSGSYSCSPAVTPKKLKPNGNRFWHLATNGALQEYNGNTFFTLNPVLSPLTFNTDESGRIHVFLSSERRVINQNSFNIEFKENRFVDDTTGLIADDAKRVGVNITLMIGLIVALVLAL